MPKLVSLFLLGFVAYNAAVNKLQDDDLDDVIFVNALFRHGDRNIITPHAGDPNKDPSNWPDGFGQLTNIGKMQEYRVGQWLRRRYDGLLTDRYSRDLVYVRSTDVDRTLMSAKCVLAGMFPPRGADVWREDLPWQPIPVHTIPEVLDKVVAQKHPCPVYTEELNRLKNSLEIANLTAKYSDVMKFLTENTGENIKTLDDINWIFHNIEIEGLHNLTVPDWFAGLYPTLYEASSYCFALPTWNRKLARLKSGLLVKELLDNLEAKRAGKTSLVMHMYAIHDTTVVSLFNTLGVYGPHIPQYGATIIMELRRDHSVTLLYRNTTTSAPLVLKFPGCETACPLDQLINLTRPLVPDDWDRECHYGQ